MSKRPIRDAVESTTDKIPSGPLSYGGGGNLLGGLGYFTVATVNGVVPIDGVDVGYSIESHNVQRRDNKEIHTYTINAVSKDVAKFVARFKSNPSNLDILGREIEVTDVTKVKERRTATTWEVTVEARKRGADNA